MRVDAQERAGVGSRAATESKPVTHPVRASRLGGHLFRVFPLGAPLVRTHSGEEHTHEATGNARTGAQAPTGLVARLPTCSRRGCRVWEGALGHRRIPCASRNSPTQLCTTGMIKILGSCGSESPQCMKWFRMTDNEQQCPGEFADPLLTRQVVWCEKRVVCIFSPHAQMEAASCL